MNLVTSVTVKNTERKNAQNISGMKIASVLGVVLGCTLIGPVAATAETMAPATAPTEMKMHDAPMKGDMQAHPAMAAPGKEMSKDMKTAPAMKMQGEGMMHANTPTIDAASLLARKDEMNLTPEQQTKLEQVFVDDKQAAAAVLTPEQQTKMSDMAMKPATMKGAHAEMHDSMMKDSHGDGSKMKPQKTKKTAAHASSMK